jgi:hypothetical protein
MIRIWPLLLFFMLLIPASIWAQDSGTLVNTLIITTPSPTATVTTTPATHTPTVSPTASTMPPSQTIPPTPDVLATVQAWATGVAATQTAQPTRDSATNRGPVFVSTPMTVAYVGQLYRYKLEAIDPDGDDVFFDVNGPDYILLVGDTIYFRPSGPSCCLTIWVVAYDKYLAATEQTYGLTILPSWGTIPNVEAD